MLPDLAIFAKSLGNRNPMAAVIGTPAAMEGVRRSSIHQHLLDRGARFAATKAVLLKVRRIDLPARCAHIGLPLPYSGAAPLRAPRRTAGAPRRHRRAPARALRA